MKMYLKKKKSKGLATVSLGTGLVYVPLVGLSLAVNSYQFYFLFKAGFHPAFFM
jgi:hypothetical protein